MSLQVEISLGEVVDRITILALKAQHMEGTSRSHVQQEAAVLSACWQQAGLPALHELPEWAGLEAVNSALWDVEDALRDSEQRQDFGPIFVELARSVYKLNDRRAALKRALNLRLGSRLIEEKAYTSDKS